MKLHEFIDSLRDVQDIFTNTGVKMDDINVKFLLDGSEIRPEGIERKSECPLDIERGVLNAMPEWETNVTVNFSTPGEPE